MKSYQCSFSSVVWCARFLVLILLCGGTSVMAQEFVGAERCKGCHEFEYLMWSQGPHRQTERQLDPEQLRDPKCNTCHTMVPGDSAEQLADVQCERCHGAGEYYSPVYIMKDQELARAVGLVDPSASDCQQCHTVGTPSIKAFNFKDMWARIAHGADARKAWEKAQKRLAPAGT